jgi:hypothetical protein
MVMQKDPNVFTLHAEKIESACVREREISGGENKASHSASIIASIMQIRPKKMLIWQ